jgi:predicted CXXCH cytochrome family protein
VKNTGFLGRMFLYVVPPLSLIGLLVAAASIAIPAPPGASPAPPDASHAASKKQQKPPKFPLNLFAQADEGDYSNEKNCANCHRTSVDSFQRSPHAVFMKDPHLPLDKQGCQACHGPSKAHVAHRQEEEGLYANVISFTHAKPEEVAAACLRCHGKTITEAHWKRTGHAHAGVSCTDCHQIHWIDRLGRDRNRPGAPYQKADAQSGTIGKTSRAAVFANAPEPKALLKADEPALCGQCHRRELAEFRHNSHHPVPEGRMVCSDCHSVHPNRDDRKQVRTAKQNCITCHADVAGPFVFEHDPVSDLTGNGCMECHRPHGSSNPRILNSFSRGLCTQCHTDKSVSHNPGRGCWDSGCHAAIHGSNHDRLLIRR